MATTEDDFQDILNAESFVDIDKLRSVARHGIPEEARGKAWKYLLGVETPDKSHEISTQMQQYREYLQYDKENTHMAKRVRGETSRYCFRRRKEFEKLEFKGKDLESRMENVVTAYMNRHRLNQLPEMLVPMCGPFVYTVAIESEVYFCFEKLLSQLDDLLATHDLNQRLANFLMLFRVLMPDLYNHFEEEEINFREWATSWFQHLLSRELPLECIVRLWDTYFAIPEGVSMHVYVCLAILFHVKDNLEELEQSEIHSLLLRLPALDMDMIISNAFRIKDEVIQQSLIELN
ncbi:rab-GTPase-TBC domain-containing protein [Entophlyctis helioformis]|nr:rab-GTPase-TBC domain-containing protein [Entophlyctis helioformis]